MDRGICTENKEIIFKLSEEEPNILNWTKEEKEVVEKLKKGLITAPILDLPVLKK